MIELDEVKAFLRIDFDDEDGYISVLILLAKEMTLNYLREQELPIELPISIKQAIFLIVAHFYENRDGKPVPNVIFRLLDPYRKEQF